MAPGYFKDCHIVALGGTQYNKDWTPQNLKRWIEVRGGYVTCKEKLTEQTTHVVMNEDTWMEQGTFVRSILSEKVEETSEQNGRVIHIVSFDWLDQCFDSSARRSESKYKWKPMAGRGEDKQPGNTQGLMAQAFLDSTETFVNAGDKKRIEKRKRQEAEDRVQELKEEKRQFDIHRKKMSVPEQAAVFRKGAKRARNDILSDNHHMYVDSTGFTFDVTITKVDFNNNANERYVLTLQIYESNTEPYSYAFNCSFGGTKVLPRNDIIAAIGSNFLTVFRAFKKTFKEYTGVDWDNRILEFNEREAKARLNGGEEKAFDDLPFEYYPPNYGPIGELPLDQAEARVAMVQAAKAEKEFQPSSVVDDWMMSGGNGSRDDSPGFNEFMATSAKETGFPPGDKLNTSPFEYPFELATGGGKDNAIVLDDDEEGTTPGAKNGEPEAPKSNTDIDVAPDLPVDEDEISLQHEDLATQDEMQSYQQPAANYEFDEALNLSQSLDVSEMPIGSSQIESQPLYTAQTQAFDQTQLAETARVGLLSDEQMQLSTNEMGEKGEATDIDYFNSKAPASVKKVKMEAYEAESQAQDNGALDDETVDLGLEFM